MRINNIHAANQWSHSWALESHKRLFLEYRNAQCECFLAERTWEKAWYFTTFFTADIFLHVFGWNRTSDSLLLGSIWEDILDWRNRTFHPVLNWVFMWLDGWMSHINFLPLELPVLSVDNLHKQFETRSGPKSYQAWSGSKLLDTLINGILKIIIQIKQLILKQNQMRKKHAKCPSIMVSLAMSKTPKTGFLTLLLIWYFRWLINAY